MKESAKADILLWSLGPLPTSFKLLVEFNSLNDDDRTTQQLEAVFFLSSSQHGHLFFQGQ